MISFSIIFVFICAILVSGCTGPRDTEIAVTPTTATKSPMAPDATATIEPGTTPTPKATVDQATPSPSVPAHTPTVGPPPAPIYTVSFTFTSLKMNSTDTVITGISGDLTDSSSGNPISGSVNSDTYQFVNVPAGHYDLSLNVQYSIYYSNNSADTGNTSITDNFEVNGNFNKTYLLN